MDDTRLVPDIVGCKDGVIRLMAYDWRIQFQPLDNEDDVGPDSGRCCPAELTILLDPRTSLLFRVGSFGHEVTHALLLPVTGLLPDGVEEVICDLIGDGLASLLRDNTAFVHGLARAVGTIETETDAHEETEAREAPP